MHVCNLNELCKRLQRQPTSKSVFLLIFFSWLRRRRRFSIAFSTWIWNKLVFFLFFVFFFCDRAGIKRKLVAPTRPAKREMAQWKRLRTFNNSIDLKLTSKIIHMCQARDICNWERNNMIDKANIIFVRSFCCGTHKYLHFFSRSFSRVFQYFFCRFCHFQLRRFNLLCWAVHVWSIVRSVRLPLVEMFLFPRCTIEWAMTENHASVWRNDGKDLLIFVALLVASFVSFASFRRSHFISLSWIYRLNSFFFLSSSRFSHFVRFLLLVAISAHEATTSTTFANFLFDEIRFDRCQWILR